VVLARYASQTPQERSVALEPKGGTPALMLAHERESFDITAGVRTLALDTASLVATSTWRVFVAASELRGHAQAVKGSSSPAVTGVYALVSAVIAALAGLPIAGLYGSERLHLVDAQPVRVARGEYVWLVRVSARYEVCAVPYTDDSEDLLEIAGGVNVADADEGAAGVPVTEFTADTAESEDDEEPPEEDPP
jgi:hypothetical protein